MQREAFDRVYADTLRFFPELVSELGGDPAPMLATAGIEPEFLSSPQPGLGYRSLATVLEIAAAELRCPDFGMRLALRQGGGKVFGPLGAVMRHAPTLGDGLAYVARHCHAHSLAARVRLDERSRQRIFVGHEILVERLPHKRQAIEQLLLLGHLNAVEITGGQARVREVHFRFQPLSPPSVYRRYFGCTVRFDQPEDGIVFTERDLQCATVEADPERFREATGLIDRHFASARPPMAAQVRAWVLQLIGSGECTKDRIAAALGLHPRTLSRRLQAEGTSYEEIKDDVRRDMALGYLHATALPLQRIAEKLGYAEHSVLSRSCSRWFADSPREIRSRALRWS